MSSGSSVADALISHLVVVSACNFDSASMSGNITKNDFGILDTTTSGCVYFVLPAAFDSEADTFGDPVGEDTEYALTVRSFVKEDNNSISTLNRVWQVERDLRQAMKASSDLSDAISMIAGLVSGAGWDGNTFITTSGGAVYIQQDFKVQVMVRE